MSIPQGFKTKENASLVCLLKRALYGFKEAPRSWYSRIDKTLLQMKMIKNLADYNMYICKREGKLMVVLLYVDDLMLIGNSIAEVQHIKRELMTQFEMSDLGEV